MATSPIPCTLHTAESHRPDQTEKFRGKKTLIRHPTGGAADDPTLRNSVSPMGSLLPCRNLSFSLVPLPPKPALLFLSRPTPRSTSSSASASVSSTSPEGDQVVRKLRSAAGAVVLSATAAVAALYAGRFAVPAAKAERLSAPPATESTVEEEEVAAAVAAPAPSALSLFLESNAEAVEALRTLLYEKLDGGEYAEGLRILDRLMAARPSETEWKFLAARVHSEMGEAAAARRLLEDILAGDPLSFEALFENTVLMDRCGEGGAAVERLERALETAREGKKEKEARDVRLIMAQLQFLQKKVEEALSSYEELAMEDPRDYRPFFCQGVIYSLLDRNQEAREKFAKYKELSPRKFEVEGFLQTSLSRVKLFGTGDAGN